MKPISITITPVVGGWIGHIDNEKGSYDRVFTDPVHIADWIQTNLPLKEERV